MHGSSRRARPLAYAFLAAATGGTAIYAFSRDNNTNQRPTTLKPRYDELGKYVPPKSPRVKTRQEHLAALKQSGLKVKTTQPPASPSALETPSNPEIYDLLVIGGGATGTGIALDAVTRGLKVALIERDDFSSGTSSKSTKLLHGGVRYLEKAVWQLDYEQFKLVQEALRERRHFSQVAPHLASWLPVMLPLQSWLKAPYFWAGAKCYDLLAGSRGYKGSYFLGPSAALEAFPMQKKEGLVGALVYYDGQHNDSRMNISLAMTAAHYGGTVVNHVEATELVKDANGQICGAKVRDTIPQGDDPTSEFTVRARGVINATGPFADAIRSFDEPKGHDIVVPSTGVHVVLPAHFCPPDMGLLDPNTSDGRVMFMLPWGGRTLVGTTDTPCKISQNPEAEESDIDWILKEIRGYLAPSISLQRSDVLAAWSGIRPLVQDPNATNTESLVRNHLVTVSDSGLLTCAGGKWTTYRQMAEDAVDKAIEVFQLQTGKPSLDAAHMTPKFNDVPTMDGSCQTQHVRLIGAHGYHNKLAQDLTQHYGLDGDIARHLVHSYGDRAWDVARLSTPGQRLEPAHPFIDGEILHAMNSELAQTAVDILARRMRLAFIDVQAALRVLPRVIEVMGEELRWDQSRMDGEWRDSVEFLKSMGLPLSLHHKSKQEVLDGSIVAEEVVESGSAAWEMPRKNTNKGHLILQGVSSNGITTPKAA